MQKRLFLAISLPEDIKKRLFRFVEKEYKELPVKWVRQENFHVTLNFLGYIPDENISGICECIRGAVEDFQSFGLDFVKTEFGPDKETKRMIWTTGEKSEELTELKYQLDRALGFFVKEKREFSPHVTLGRIKREQWRKIFPRTTKNDNHLSAGRESEFVVRGRPEPNIEKDFKFSVSVDSVELYESKFEKGKRVYYVLESFALSA